MMNDLVYGIRLTGDGKQLVAEIDASARSVDKFVASTSKMASQYTGLNTVVKEHAAAVTDTDAKVNRLLDRYDPLGAKLRQLQADFKALDTAASTGRIAGRDDARVDQVYVRLQKEINAASASTAAFDGTSKSAALSAGQLRMATQQLPLQFQDIWVSLAAGQNPMMVLAQQGTQISGSFGGVSAAAPAMGRYVLGLVNPFTLAAAAVAAGAVAWSAWGDRAEEAAAKAKAALDEAEKLAKSTKRMTPAEEVQDINKQIAALKEQNFWKEKNTPSMKAVMDSENSQLFSGASEERKRRELHLATIKANTESINNLERNRLDIEKQIAQQAEAENKKKSPRSEVDQIRQQEQQVLQSLQKQADGYQQLSKVEQTRWEIEHGNYRKFSDQAKQQILLEAQLADAKDAETKAVKASKDAWDESAKVIDKVNTSSKEYLAQLQFETSLLGLSTLEIQKRTEARRLDAQLEKDLQALRNSDNFKARDTNPEVMSAYKKAEGEVKAAAATTKAAAAAEIDARDKVSKSWEFGSKEAIRKYDEQVRNSAAQAEALYTKGFKGAEDAVTHFMMTGKADIKSFANSVIEEFMRINVARPLVSAGAGMLGDLFKGAFGGGGFDLGSLFGGGRATGGPVDRNRLYRVNEAGPEMLNYDGADYLMMGGRGGYVKPLGNAIAATASAPSQLLQAGPAPAAAPQISIQVINSAPGVQVTPKQQMGSDGAMNLIILVEQLDSALADRASRGNSQLASVMENKYGLNASAGAYR